MFTETAEVKVKNDKGEEVAKQGYTKVVFHATGKDKEGNYAADGTSPEQLFSDAIAFMQKDDPKSNPIIGLLSLATYAYDLGQRATVRQGLVAALEGPDKAVNKAIDNLMKARAALGKPISAEKARAIVEALG